MNWQVFGEIAVRFIPWVLAGLLLILPNVEPVAYHPKNYKVKRKLKYLKGGK